MALVVQTIVRHLLVHNALQLVHEATRVQVVDPQLSPAQHDALELVYRNHVYWMRDAFQGANSLASGMKLHAYKLFFGY